MFTPVAITRVTGAGRIVSDDVVAIEEPLEIRAGWLAGGEPHEKVVAVTMRTPGDDFDLAAGFLLGEGLIRSSDAIEGIRHWGSPNQVRVALRSPIKGSKLDRRFFTNSSCGVCGKTSIDALRATLSPVRGTRLAASLVDTLPALLTASQSAFVTTGGVHGAALVDAAGVLLAAREDVGRHNAVDKVIGSFVRNGSLPPAGSILMVSSRGSFEIVQKAIVAGICAVAFAGPPSSLAVELARECNVTLLGFVRQGRFNVYAGEVH